MVSPRGRCSCNNYTAKGRARYGAVMAMMSGRVGEAMLQHLYQHCGWEGHCSKDLVKTVSVTIKPPATGVETFVNSNRWYKRRCCCNGAAKRKGNRETVSHIVAMALQIVLHQQC